MKMVGGGDEVRPTLSKSTINAFKTVTYDSSVSQFVLHYVLQNLTTQATLSEIPQMQTPPSRQTERRMKW